MSPLMPTRFLRARVTPVFLWVLSFGRLTTRSAESTVSERVPAEWRERFGAAYTAELQAWITGLVHGECVGPSAWEGYAATKVVEVGVEAVKTGERMTIDYIQKPALYR